MRYDSIVIGSGFGGAVTAARLAERGMRVLVLERGPWWGGDPGPAPDRRPFPRGVWGARKLIRNIRWSRTARRFDVLLHADGLFEWHAFRHLDVITGSGVGGGSLVYTSIQHQPDDDFFDGFPAEIDARSMAPYYDRVRAMMRPSPLPDRPAKNRAFEDALRAAGFDPPVYPDLAIAWGARTDIAETIRNAAGIEQKTCTHRGECVLGCPQRSKTTLDLTYIPVAQQHGATIRPLCEVIWIGERPGGYEVRWRDRLGGTNDAAIAPRVVLAAGTLNTLRLLFAARDRWKSLPRVSAALGQHFSPNADMAVVLWRTRTVGDSSHGAALNAFVRRPARGTLEYVVGEAGVPLSALKVPAPLRSALRRTVFLLAMGRDSADGVISWDGRGIRSDIDRTVGRDVFDAIERDAERVARAYAPARLLLNWPAGRGSRRIGSVHPLGGASIAALPVDGVVDHRGEVFGHPGLFVADGSLYPRAPGGPPSMTIAALAERIAALMTA
jgi:cholesterol oxidase